MTTLIIPMAGAGSRFVAAGFKDPKPFIRVDGYPMFMAPIRDCAELLGKAPERTILLCRTEHSARLQADLELFPCGTVPTVVTVPELTDGAASTVLLAKDLIDRDEDVIVANSDQTLGLSDSTVKTFAHVRSVAEAIPLCFTSDGHGKWSYVETWPSGKFKDIIEKPAKPPAGNPATCGLYWFRSAGNMFQAIERMRAANFRVNGEFYFAPCHGFLYYDPIIPVFVDEMHGLGTPEDLDAYLSRPPLNFGTGN